MIYFLGTYQDFTQFCSERGLDRHAYHTVVFLSDFISLNGRQIYEDDEIVFCPGTRPKAYDLDFWDTFESRKRKGNRP